MSTVALFVFNRPFETSVVLSALKSIGVTRLLVVADGPRAGVDTDIINCQAVRDQILSIDWVNDKRINFSEENLGLKARFGSGLHWVFEQVDEAIIIEDDCVPTRDFIDFARRSLEQFRDDESIGMIQGWSILNRLPLPSAHYLSYRPKIWGWATWSRAVRGYDPDSVLPPHKVAMRRLANLGYPPLEARSFLKKLRTASAIGTWDYQWAWHLLAQRQGSIAPTKSLVANIGFGPDATHTKSSMGVFDDVASDGNKDFLEHRLGSWSRLLDLAEGPFLTFLLIKSAFLSPRVFIETAASRVRNLLSKETN